MDFSVSVLSDNKNSVFVGGLKLWATAEKWQCVITARYCVIFLRYFAGARMRNGVFINVTGNDILKRRRYFFRKNTL